MSQKFRINLLSSVLGLLFFALWFWHRNSPLDADWRLGPLQIHFYTLCFVVGIFVSFNIIRHFIKESDLRVERFDKLALISLITGLLGARIFFVVGNPQTSKSLINFLAFWRGGLAFYGGLIAVLLTIFVARFFWRFSLGKFLDCLALGLPLGQAIGRLGNFFNQEAYGRPANGFWGTFISPEHRLPGFGDKSFFQPTFLWESFGLIVLFLVLYNLRPFLKNQTMVLLGIYAIGAGLLRALLENLRLDSLHWGGLLPSQLAAIVLFSTGLIIISLYARKVS